MRSVNLQAQDQPPSDAGFSRNRQASMKAPQRWIKGAQRTFVTEASAVAETALALLFIRGGRLYY